jgi:hypothetical protein
MSDARAVKQHLPHRLHRLMDRCPYRKLDSSVAVVEPTNHGLGNDAAKPLDSTPNRRIFAQRQVRSALVVQHDDRTPTGSRSTSFFTRGILGLDAWFTSMRWSRRLVERFSVAASLVGHPIGGWRFQPGCSIGRLVPPGRLAPLPMSILLHCAPWRRCCRM